MSAAPAEAPPPPVAIREKGYAFDGDTTGFWTDLTKEATPELRWPNSIHIFERMRSQDAQVSSVLRAVTSPIMRTNYSIDGNGCRDEVTEFIASNLGLPVKGTDPDDTNTAGLRGRDRFSWNSHVKTSLLMLPFGHSFFEQVYRYDAQGRARLRKLAHRPQTTIFQVNVARDGGLVSIEQSAPLGVTPTSLGMSAVGITTIPVNRLVAYALDREGGNWLGRSILRPAYKNWLLKDRALRAWSTSVDRNSVGVPIYKAAPGEKDLTPGEEMAKGARGGDNAGGAVPHGADLEFKGVIGTLPDADKFVRYQDEQIARAVLAHFLNLGTQTGSWALGSTFADFFTLSLQSVAADFVDVSNSHIVEDLVDINFGRTEPAPRIVFEEIGSRGGVEDELTMLRKAAGLEDDEQLTEFLRTHVTTGGTGQ